MGMSGQRQGSEGKSGAPPSCTFTINSPQQHAAGATRPSPPHPMPISSVVAKKAAWCGLRSMAAMPAMTDTSFLLPAAPAWAAAPAAVAALPSPPSTAMGTADNGALAALLLQSTVMLRAVRGLVGASGVGLMLEPPVWGAREARWLTSDQTASSSAGSGWCIASHNAVLFIPATAAHLRRSPQSRSAPVTGS